jgi:hypothetical protein
LRHFFRRSAVAALGLAALTLAFAPAPCAGAAPAAPPAPGAASTPGKAPAAKAPAAPAVTDEAVIKAIDKGLDFLIKQQGANGLWPEKKYYDSSDEVGTSELCLMTLLYTGMHPNREAVSRPLDALLVRPLDYTYAVAARVMALSHAQPRLVGVNRDIVRTALKRDVQWLVQTQNTGGGWGYNGLAGSKGSRTYQDLSNTQMVVLALREAAIAGVEIPRQTWQRVQDLYFRLQRPDGSWNYGETDSRTGGATAPGYGSMTAAGLASIFITMDNLDAASGCPCRGNKSSRSGAEVERRIDAALGWLEKHYKVDTNPEGGKFFAARNYYWLYSAERAGDSAGYKYFGGHDWFQEGAAYLLKKQAADGSWTGQYGKIVTTCFATLFLYKGRGPILFNKLQFDGQWNNHRRDIANLTQYISLAKEQVIHWQIVNLRGPVEELHDAPVLYITAEDAPVFSEADKAKLRLFTDTGGTVLMEASCGNPSARKALTELAAAVWPQWPIAGVGPDHPVFVAPYKLKQRPEIRGIDDGIRTFLFYADDDISCHWQTKAYTGKGYLFEWGINLAAYATDSAPLRAKLASREAVADKRFVGPVKAGPKAALRVVRVRHAGNWDVGAHYQGLSLLAAHAKKAAALAVETIDTGVAPADLKPTDIAYVTGSRAVEFTPDDVAALKAHVAAGGRVWLESAAGSSEFDQAVRRLAEAAGWTLQPAAKTHPLLTGRLDPAVGYPLASGVRFRRALRVIRTGRDYADLHVVLADGKPAGVYSPLDVVFSATPYEAGECRGYESADAAAVATNILLDFSR